MLVVVRDVSLQDAIGLFEGRGAGEPEFDAERETLKADLLALLTETPRTQLFIARFKVFKSKVVADGLYQIIRDIASEAIKNTLGMWCSISCTKIFGAFLERQEGFKLMFYESDSPGVGGCGYVRCNAGSHKWSHNNRYCSIITRTKKELLFGLWGTGSPKSYGASDPEAPDLQATPFHTWPVPISRPAALTPPPVTSVYEYFTNSSKRP